MMLPAASGGVSWVDKSAFAKASADATPFIPVVSMTNGWVFPPTLESYGGHGRRSETRGKVIMRKYIYALSFMSLFLFYITHANVVKITRMAHIEELKKEKPHIVLKFFATWCPPCQTVKPLFEKIAKDDTFKHVVFAEINIDKNQDIALKYGAKSIPTVIYVKEGEIKQTELGAQDFKNRIHNNIKKHFPKK